MERWMFKKGPALGVDVGTTNICIGLYQEGNVEILDNSLGNKKTPCVLAFIQEELGMAPLSLTQQRELRMIAGETAMSQMAMNPNNTVIGLKHLTEGNSVDQFVNWMTQYPFTIPNTDGGRIKVDGVEETFDPKELYYLMLQIIMEIEFAYIRQKPSFKDAVITVPAYFTFSQRLHMTCVEEYRHLNVLRILSEPTAAAFAYVLSGEVAYGSNLMIIGLGGFTSEISILTIDVDRCEFHAASRDVMSGGYSFDDNMVNYFVDEFERNHNRNIRTNRKSMHRLRVACERAKRTLSIETSASVEVDSLFEGIGFNRKITRAKFEYLNITVFQRIIAQVRKALIDANMDKTQIHDIVLVGGSTRIPGVQKRLQEFFNGQALHMSINPNYVVAIGAAQLAAYHRLHDFEENYKRLRGRSADRI